MKLILCLGNPGNKYINTRHNAGFMFADMLALRLNGIFNFESKFNSQIAKCEYLSEAVWIIKPQTFMNNSGEAFSLIKNFYKLNVNDFFVVYDDISLDTGVIRFRSKGSDGGHNGIKSVIMHAQTDKIERLKIGIGPQPPFMKSEDYVLQNFPSDITVILKSALDRAVDAFLYYLESKDLVKVQNKFN